jgi:hypothetical protein
MRNTRTPCPAKIAITFSSLLLAGLAHGNDATGTNGTYYQVEGEANCNSFSSNSVGTYTVSNPSGSGQASDGALNALYSVTTVNGLPSVSWEIQQNSQAVNAVILVGNKIQGQQKSVVYHFGLNGSAMDSNEIGPGVSLAKLRFCYGLGPLVTLPAQR